MKARFVFYFAAVVALVLFLAATSSHATERRDPVVSPEQTQSASTHATDSATPAHSSHPKKTAHPAAKSQTRAKMAQKKNPDSGVGTAGNGK
ncbi:MAG TPA: hypothetical protein VGI45_02130 [Terracidiphilus sp.]